MNPYIWRISSMGEPMTYNRKNLDRNQDTPPKKFSIFFLLYFFL